MKPQWMAWMNSALLAVIAFLLMGPSGPLGSRIVDWRQARADLALAGLHWERAKEVATPLHPAKQVTLVEVIDYECPFCRASHPFLKSFLAGSDEGTIAVLQYPLSFHKRAHFGAALALCAAEQGRFRQAHDFLSTQTSWMKTEDPDGVASAIGIDDPVRYQACIESAETVSTIEDHIALVRELGIQATPALIGPDGRHVGAFDSVTIVSIAR